METARGWFAVLLAFVSLFPFVAGASAAESLGAVKIPDTVIQVVVSSTSGTVAAIDSAQQGVVLYPNLSSKHTSQGSTLIPLPAKAVAICHKPAKNGGVFIVADEQRSIHIMQDPGGKLVGSVKLESMIYDIAAPPNVDSNHVFYATSSRVARSITGRPLSQGGRIGRIDLAAMKDLGLFDTSELSRGRCIIELASDGKTIYLAGTESSGGYVALRLEKPEDNQLVEVRQGNAVSGFVPLPFGMGTAVNKEIRNVELEEKIRDLPAKALCAMTSRPVLFALTDPRQNGVLAISINTGQEISGVNLPSPQQLDRARAAARAAGRGAARAAAGDESSARLRPMKPTAFVDEVNQNLLMLSNGFALVVPLTAFKLPQEPVIAAKIEGPTELVVSRPWTASIVTSDKNISLSLADAPSGVKLEGNKLSWTPGPENIGATRVGVRLVAGDVKTDQQIELVVRQQASKLPFAVGSYAISPDGSKLVVVAAGPEFNGTPARTSRLAAIDLRSGGVLFEKELEFRLPNIANLGEPRVAASNDAIYLGSDQSDALYSISFADPQQVKKTFTDGRVYGLAVLGQRLYFSLAARHISPPLPFAHRLPGLEPIESITPAEYRGLFKRSGKVPFDVGSGWRLDEGVWAKDFSKVRLLLDAPAFAGIYLRGNEYSTDPAVPFTQWGILVDSMQIRRVGGQTIVQLPGHPKASCALVDLPAAAFLRLIFDHDQPTGPMHRVELALVDLVKGKETVVLLANDPRKDLGSMFEQRQVGRNIVASLPGKLVIIAGDRLFVAPISHLSPQQFPEPLHFEAEQSPLLIPATGVSKLMYKVRGGQKPLRFSLLHDAPGLEIDANSGELRLDVQKLLSEQRLAKIADRYAHWTGRFDGPFALAATRPSLTVLQAAQPQIQMAEKMVGTKLKGVPVALDLGVRVRDAGGQENLLEHVILVDLPAQLIQKQFDERMKAGREMMEQQRRQNAGQRTVPQNTAAPTTNRVHELELENARLRGQIEALMEMRRRSPASQPTSRPR